MTTASYTVNAGHFQLTTDNDNIWMRLQKHADERLSSDITPRNTNSAAEWRRIVWVDALFPKEYFLEPRDWLELGLDVAHKPMNFALDFQI